MEPVKIMQHFDATERKPRFAFDIFEEIFKKQIRSTRKRTDLKKAVATELLKDIAIIKKIKHHTDFLTPIDFISGVW